MINSSEARVYRGNTPSPPPNPTEPQTRLHHLQTLPAAEALSLLLTFCASKTWAHHLTQAFPYPTPEAFLTAAEKIWHALPEPDWQEAFAAHPRIGEPQPPNSPGVSFFAEGGGPASAFLTSSTSEQSTTQSTLNPALTTALQTLNQTYEQKFGFRYIVFASDRTAPELLALLETRLNNTREEELQEAARQQHRITQLRIQKWLNA
jgi:OHCU decarboxylase